MDVPSPDRRHSPDTSAVRSLGHGAVPCSFGPARSRSAPLVRPKGLCCFTQCSRSSLARANSFSLSASCRSCSDNRTWLIRYTNHGLTALADRSSRPDRCPRIRWLPRSRLASSSCEGGHPGWAHARSSTSSVESSKRSRLAPRSTAVWCATVSSTRNHAGAGAMTPKQPPIDLADLAAAREIVQDNLALPDRPVPALL